MTSNEPIRLSDVELALPPSSMHAGHPLRNVRTHKRLVDFVIPRIEIAAKERDTRIERYKAVDKQIYGWIRLDDEEQRRKDKKDETGQPLAVQQHMPLSLIHLQDTIAFYAGVFAPTRGMFQHVGDANEQPLGQQLLKVMNNHAQHAGYYKELMRAVFDLHKYQAGGLIIEWDTEPGNQITRQNGQIAVEPVIAWEGNRLRAVDMYNAFWPNGVFITELDLKAEFFADVKLTNYFEIQKKSASGEWLNTGEILEAFVNKQRLPQSTRSRSSFYVFPPAELQLASDSLSKQQGPWAFMAGAGGSDLQGGRQNGIYELMTVWVWLNPFEQSLVPRNAVNKRTRNRLELWRLEIIEGRWLVSADHMPNAHARIPLAMGTLGNDALGEWQKSTAEILRPLQDFLSFLLNTHISGVRGNIWGLTIFNPEVVDLNQLPAGEVVGRIPAKPTGQDLDLSRAIFHDSNPVDTRQTVADFERVLGIIERLFPTQSLPSQVAGIDRAVDRQVAAVIQGGNRPLQMSARFIDETMLRNMRTLLYFNIIQFQNDIEVTGLNGEPEKVDAESLQDVKLEYLIGQGLKALDKQTVAQEFQRMLFALMQSQAAQEVDILALIDTWSDFLDIDIDLTQFRKQVPPQEVTQTQGVSNGDASS